MTPTPFTETGYLRLISYWSEGDLRTDRLFKNRLERYHHSTGETEVFPR
jgi:hypothetical protein